MSERKHGQRYSFKEKKDILDYLERHTYKETSEKFEVSETTLSRWKKEIKSGSNYNRTKIIISLPKFWLEYLNEQIEADVWEDYSDAFLNILRDHFKNQTSNRRRDLKYLDNVKEIIPELLELDPNIDAMLLLWETEVIYKSDQWGSTEGIQSLIENWKKMNNQWKNSTPWYKTETKRSRRVKEFEFQNIKYNIRDMSVKHLIGVQKIEDLPPTGEDQEKIKFILGLKRKLTEDSAYIFAKAKGLGGNFSLVMNTLKRVAMGSIPPLRELPHKNYIFAKVNDETEAIEKFLKRRISDEYHWEKQKLEQNKMFQIKTNPLLMQLASQVNKPLKPEEKDVLETLEKQLGKEIERINADPEQETNKREVYGLPWLRPDEEFPASKFPCHYIALNGEIILLSLFNLGLSEIPSEIPNFKNLTHLCLALNNIKTLPKGFSNLKSLEVLNLNNNQFIKVPDSIVELPRLHYLYMKNNKITEIPVTLTDAWNTRLKDRSYRRSVYIPANLIFSGNPIDRSSLSKEQEFLVKGIGTFDKRINATIQPLIYLIID